MIQLVLQTITILLSPTNTRHSATHTGLQKVSETDFKDCFQLKGRNVRDLTQFGDGRGDRCNSSPNWIHPVELQDNCHNLHRHQDQGEEGVLPPFAQSLPGHPIPHGLLGEDILHPLLLQTLRTPQTTPSQSLPAFFWSRPLSSSLQN